MTGYQQPGYWPSGYWANDYWPVSPGQLIRIEPITYLPNAYYPSGYWGDIYWPKAKTLYGTPENTPFIRIYAVEDVIRLYPILPTMRVAAIQEEP